VCPWGVGLVYLPAGSREGGAFPALVAGKARLDGVTLLEVRFHGQEWKQKSHDIEKGWTDIACYDVGEVDV